MEIISIHFLIFVLLTLVVYYLLAPRAQNIWLLLASYVFYALWNIWFVAVLALTTLLNFIIAKKIWQGGNNKKSWLIVGVFIDILSLAFLKLIAAGAFEHPIEASLSILIPIGFSFYILQAISYLLDVQNRRLPASTNLVDFALYMAYFPKMVSGPIERARIFLPILSSARVVDGKKFSDGITLIVIGLVRKLVFAQILSTSIPDGIFSNFSQYTGFSLLCALILYAFWLYNDFAGYTSLVRGISFLFGIELTPNFQQPYFSRNFTEFWNRWHISLSHWLRDYIFFPLSRWLSRNNPKGNGLINVIIPPLVTMLASGLWHNFSLSMLVWGALHAFYQIVERFITLWRSHPPVDKQPAWKQILSALLVFCFVTFAWVPFASGSVINIYGFIRMVVGKSFFNFPGGMTLQGNLLRFPAIVILITLLMDWIQYHSKDETIFNKWPPVVKSVIFTMALFALLAMFVLQVEPVKAFIYQGF